MRERRAPPPSAPALIVVGASAGGIEALIALVRPLPPSYPIPMVAVIHLPRDRPSLLVDVIGARTALRVREAEDKEPLAPGLVVAPADYHVLIDIDGERGPCLALSNDAPVSYCRPSVDVLFQSAAESLGARVVGVVLSGANADGADGLRAIKARGGRCAAQLPDEAGARAMPEAAIARAKPELVGSLADIAQWLSSFAALERGTGPHEH